MSRKSVDTLVTVLALVGSFGCGDAAAMGKKPSTPPPAPPPPHVDAKPKSERYRQGLVLGLSNGERMVEQIKRATIGVNGCAGQPNYEKGLVAVVKAIRPPKPGPGEDLDLARGYYEGYSTAFGRALRAERVGCDLPVVVEPSLPGTIIGSLLCGAAGIDVLLLDTIEVDPIYPGWAGGNDASRSECANVAVKITDGCIVGHESDREKVEKILEDQIARGCRD